MASIGSLALMISADTAKLTQGLTQAQSTVSSFVGKVNGVLAGLGIGFSAGAALSAYGDQLAAEKRLESVVRSTGMAAGFSADQIKVYAKELQQVTNYSDQATIAGAAVLATFTKIGGQVFKDAIVSAQDLSAIMGQDLQSSIVQIGKALNDPIAGLTALRRAGVSFTDEQRKMIEGMVAVGDLTGAQRIILQELQTEFGGAARNLASPMQMMKNSFTDLLEVVGKALKPAMNDLAGLLKGVTNLVIENFGAANAWAASLKNVAVAFSLVSAAVTTLAAAMATISIAKLAITSISIGSLLLTLAALAALVVLTVPLLQKLKEERAQAALVPEHAKAMHDLARGPGGDDALARMAAGHTAALAEAADPIEKFAGKLGDLRDKLREEGETFGMTASMAEIYKMRKEGIGDDALALLRPLAEEVDLMKRLTGEFSVAGNILEQYGTRLKAVVAAGANGELTFNEVTQAVNKLNREFDKSLQAEATKTFNETRNPVENFSSQIDLLNEQLRQGVISWDTYGRAVGKAYATVANAAGAVTSPAALRFGEQGTYSAQAKAENASASKSPAEILKQMMAAQKQMDAENRKLLQELPAIRKALEQPEQVVNEF